MTILTEEERQALANAMNSSVQAAAAIATAGGSNHFMNHHANV